MKDESRAMTASFFFFDFFYILYYFSIVLHRDSLGYFAM